MAGLIENKILPLTIAILIPFLEGFLFNFLAGKLQSMHPSPELKQPDWSPPNQIFGTIWVFLYVSMGYASYRVWFKGEGFSGRAETPLMIYIMHQVFNLTWTITFFKFHLLGWATIHLLAISIVVIINGVAFYKIDKTAGYLFIPYVLWCAFSIALHAAIWKLN